jgi:hypothetical protein
MTIREKLTRQKRLADFVSIAGIGGAMLFFYVASSLNRWWVFAGICCALAAFSGTIYRYHAIRCPQCSARLTGVITSPTNPFAAPRDIVCCPFCQVSFDAEVASTQSA